MAVYRLRECSYVRERVDLRLLPVASDGDGEVELEAWSYAGYAQRCCPLPSEQRHHDHGSRWQ